MGLFLFSVTAKIYSFSPLFVFPPFQTILRFLPPPVSTRNVSFAGGHLGSKTQTGRPFLGGGPFLGGKLGLFVEWRAHSLLIKKKEKDFFWITKKKKKRKNGRI